jgi:hypothetical protein
LCPSRSGCPALLILFCMSSSACPVLKTERAKVRAGTYLRCA